MLLELVVVQLEARLDGLGVDRRARLVAAGGQDVGQQRLQHGEALRRDRAAAPHDGLVGLGLVRAGTGVRRRLALVDARDLVEAVGDVLDERVRLERQRLAVQREQPARQQPLVGIGRREDDRAVVAVLDLAVAAGHALDHPGRAGRDPDRGGAGDLAELPLRALAVDRGVEVGRHLEVALAARGEAHVAAHARQAERADRVAVLVAADHVPVPGLHVDAVGVERARRVLVALHRPVREDDRALLRDGRLDLGQARRDRGGVAACRAAGRRRSARCPRSGSGRPSARFCSARRSGSAYANWPSSR